MSTTIDHAGFVISTPGNYVLSTDLIYSSLVGAAILITCDNVTIDFAGHSITGNGRNNSFAMGIRSDKHSNIDVYGGTISGFFYGINLTDDHDGLGAGGHDIKNMTVLDSSFRGILVSGQDCSVTNCTIKDVGGTTNFANSFAAAIELFGDLGVVSGNTVREVHPNGTGEGLGISISSNSHDTVVANNSIMNGAQDGHSGFGVWIGGDSDVTLRNNTIANFKVGFAYSSPPVGDFLYNEISGWYSPYGPMQVGNAQTLDQGGNKIHLTDADDVFSVGDYYVGPAHVGLGFILFGGAGNDTITGDVGNDTFYGGAGADTIDGGAGIDTIAFDDAAYGTFRVSLTDAGLNNGAALGDSYINVENLVLSRGNDVAYGSATVNVIEGRAGNDKLFGLDNDDSLFGQDGNDILFGGNGADKLDGGAGFDYAAYDDASYASFRVSLTSAALNAGVALGDSFVAIEGLILSGGDDVAYGNAADNYIYGRAGNDTLYGYAGKDVLFGEDGADRFMFNTAPSAANADTIVDFVSGLDSIGLANYYYGGAKDGAGELRLFQGAGITGSAVHAKLGAILFDTNSGVLSYDADGAGAGAAVQIATLANAHALDHNDLFLI